MNIPNWLSVLRVLLIPVLVLAYYLPIDGAHKIAAFVFMVAAFSDWLDGFLARKLNQTSRFGEFIDPVADKLIVAAAIILMISKGGLMWLTLPSIIIISREIAVSALREWMAEIGKRAHVAVSWIGKAKTAMQLLSLTVLLACSVDSPWWALGVGYFLYYGAAILTVWSMVLYFKAAWSDLRASI